MGPMATVWADRIMARLPLVHGYEVVCKQVNQVMVVNLLDENEQTVIVQEFPNCFMGLVQAMHWAEEV